MILEKYFDFSVGQRMIAFYQNVEFFNKCFMTFISLYEWNLNECKIFDLFVLKNKVYSSGP